MKRLRESLDSQIALLSQVWDDPEEQHTRDRLLRVFIGSDDPEPLKQAKPAGASWNFVVLDEVSEEFSPLILAMQAKAFRVVEYLIQDGADPHMETGDFATPFSIALRKAKLGGNVSEEFSLLWKLRVPLSPANRELEPSFITAYVLDSTLDVLGQTQKDDPRTDFDPATQDFVKFALWYRTAKSGDPLYTELLDSPLDFNAVVAFGGYALTLKQTLISLLGEFSASRTTRILGLCGLQLLEEVRMGELFSSRSSMDVLYSALINDPRQYTSEGLGIKRAEFDGESELYAALKRAIRLPRADVPMFPSYRLWRSGSQRGAEMLSAWELMFCVLPPCETIALAYGYPKGLAKIVKTLEDRPELHDVPDFNVAIVIEAQHGFRLKQIGWTIKWRMRDEDQRAYDDAMAKHWRRPND